MTILCVLFHFILFHKCKTPKLNLLLLQRNNSLPDENNIARLQEELIAVKLREAEAVMGLKELRQQVKDLEEHWQVCQYGMYAFCKQSENQLFHLWEFEGSRYPSVGESSMEKVYKLDVHISYCSILNLCNLKKIK